MLYSIYILLQKRQGAVFKSGQLGNYEEKTSSAKKGPGEGGKPHYVAEDKQNDAQMLMMQYGINMAVSNDIALSRSIPDFRLEECKHWFYPENLPRASVVIVFHNEGFSTLMRTVQSVLDRSPPQFLEEVLLIDDFSDKENLGGTLVDFIRRYEGKVRLARNGQREGLIRSKSIGAEKAIGEVVIFLDAHCEVNPNWLPPLLTPIYTNRTVMTVPVIDGIDKDTLEYRPVYHGKTHYRGIFEWGMFYKENEIPEEEVKRRKHVSEPYFSPTHAGGLFAMNRKYFLELGAYDPGLLVWGGENFELSFKIWQCGGSIVWVPCSRVGHIYRGFMPYSFGKLGEKAKGPLVQLNYKRVVDVWMDEYKENFYAREPLSRKYDAGDISQQIALRKKLKCKPFSWFMKNVAYDVLDKYPLQPKNLYWGEIRSMSNGACVDSMGMSPPRVISTSHCHGAGGSQYFRLNAEGQLGVGERCIEADSTNIKLAYCHLGRVNGPWSYDADSKTIIHTKLKKCMEVSKNSASIKLRFCNSQSDAQKWVFRELSLNT
ncbi:N-acetylgalactosaminyltransferase 7 [Nymphon striatum]|nr:N-acetylgalactosaminyltransferase 7 [Nymphon striatum]